MDLDALIRHALTTPFGTEPRQPSYGFRGLATDGTPLTGLTCGTFEDMARSCLSRCVPGVAYLDIVAACDAAGALTEIEVGYMDEIHNPAERRVSIRF